jgi:hypothetical protein
MITILRTASVLQRALDNTLADPGDDDESNTPGRLASLLWPIMLCQLGVAPLRLPRDCLSVTVTSAAPCLLSFSKAVLDPVRAALRKAEVAHADGRTVLTNASNALSLIQRAVSPHSPLHAAAMSAVSAFFQLICFVLREDCSQKGPANSIALSLQSLAPTPATHALLALTLWLAGDVKCAAAESEKAVQTALKAAQPSAAAAVAFAFYVRGEVRRGVLAQGDGSSRSFEWAEDLRRADKENPSPAGPRLSSLSLQAATSANLTPARQTQAALSLLAVFQAVGFAAVMPPVVAPEQSSLSDSDWASHLESMALLLTYFPTASELLAAFGVSSSFDCEEISALSSSLSQLLRDDRMQRLALLASRVNDEACPSRHPFPTTTGSIPRRGAEDSPKLRETHAPAEGSPRRESTPNASSSAVPKMIRRFSAATEAELLRTQQRRSFWHSRPVSAAASRPYSRSFSFSKSPVD